VSGAAVRLPAVLLLLLSGAALGCGGGGGDGDGSGTAGSAPASDAATPDEAMADAGCPSQPWQPPSGDTGSLSWSGDDGSGSVMLSETGADPNACDATTQFCAPAVSLGGPVASASGDFDVTFVAAGFVAGNDGDTVALIVTDGHPENGDWARATYSWSPDGQGDSQIQATLSHAGSAVNSAPQSFQAGNVSDTLVFHAVRRSGMLTISVTDGSSVATQQGPFVTAPMLRPLAMLGVYSTPPGADSGPSEDAYVTLQSISLVASTPDTIHSDGFACDDLGSLESR
jgi:hypothetical protein